MAKIKLTCADGIQEVDGRRFSHYVQNIRFWFAFHKSIDHVAQHQVTHIDSGKRVCFVPNIALAASRGDQILAARGEIDKLCERVGEARVRSVLAGAA